MDLLLREPHVTDEFGASLARAYLAAWRRIAPDSLTPGSGTLYLHGDLGAGKSTCVRSLLRSLGVRGHIRSPTYTLLDAYSVADLTCVHMDLYRLGSPAEVDELGLRDYFDVSCLLMVEWAEKGGSTLPPSDLAVTLSYAGSARSVKIAASSRLGMQWLDCFQNDTSFEAYVPNLT